MNIRVWLLAAGMFLPCIATGQEAPTVAAAVAVRDSGDMTRAASMLREILEREPGNGDAARTLAQTLYWMKDVRGAQELYERSMTLHPEDHSLRLDYARMLVETGSEARARQILIPLLEFPEARAGSATLLGTMEYWNGDYRSAARNFRVALQADSSAADARRMLDEIRAVASPWFSVGGAVSHDDQPMDGFGGEVIAGAFIDPLTSVSGALRPMRVEGGDSSVANVVAGEVAVSSYAPGAHLESSIGAGVVRHSAEGVAATTDWTARAALRGRIASHVSLEGRFTRAPYFYTIASLRQLTMSQAGSIALALTDYHGWLGESGARVERFPDGNNVRSIYAWGLAPVVRAQGATIRAGYAVSYQDADENRFRSADSSYAPYYTPENILVHSAIASAEFRPSPRTRLSARGGYGFHASEDAPIPLGVVNLSAGFTRRNFNPWDAHAAIEVAASDGVSVSVFGDAFKTAAYSSASGGIRITIRLRRSATR